MTNDIKTIKVTELKKIINKIFPNTKYISITDRDYAYIDLDWVEDDAYKGYEKWLSIFSFNRNINNSSWKKNFDCEDLSNSFKLYLKLLHAEANPNTFSSGKKNTSETESVLVGNISYDNSKSTAHSINIFFDGLNNAKFFEPMYGKFINFSEKQKEQTWYVSF